MQTRAEGLLGTNNPDWLIIRLTNTCGSCDLRPVLPTPLCAQNVTIPSLKVSHGSLNPKSRSWLTAQKLTHGSHVGYPLLGTEAGHPSSHPVWAGTFSPSFSLSVFMALSSYPFRFSFLLWLLSFAKWMAFPDCQRTGRPTGI